MIRYAFIKDAMTKAPTGRVSTKICRAHSIERASFIHQTIVQILTDHVQAACHGEEQILILA